MTRYLQPCPKDVNCDVLGYSAAWVLKYPQLQCWECSWFQGTSDSGDECLCSCDVLARGHVSNLHIIADISSWLFGASIDSCHFWHMFLIILSLSEWRSVMLSLRALFVFQRVSFYLRLKEALELLSKMERIQLQFWPWKSQHFVNSSMTLRPCVQNLPPHPNWFNYFLTFSTFFVCQKFFLTTLPRLFLRKVLVRPDLVAYSTGVFACQQAASWQGLFKGMGSWCRVFLLEKIRKKMDHRLNFFNLVNLPQLAQLAQLIQLLNLLSQNAMKSHVYLKLPHSNIWGWEVSGGRVVLWEKKDVQAILHHFLCFFCLLVLGGVSPLFILLPSLDDEICGWDLNP